MKIYELKSIYGKNKNSYYGKAVVIEQNGNLYLQSYSTIVCGIVNGWFEKYWNNYSVTTSNHIRDFRMQNGLPDINKKHWMELETKETSINSVITTYKTNYYH